MLGLLCCTWAFSRCGKGGAPLWYSLQAFHCSNFSGGARALEQMGVSSCSPWALLFPSMWDLPGPEIEPVSPVLAGRFVTTGPPGGSPTMLLRVQSALRMPCKAKNRPGAFSAKGRDSAKSHVQLSSLMDCSPPSSFVHGILQARILEWAAISF